MAGPSGRKEGLRRECGGLLIEKDPEMGLGVRCGRDDCRKFHTLDEINLRAAEFEKEKEKRREKMFDEGRFGDLEMEKKSMFHALELLKCHGGMAGVEGKLKVLKKVVYYFTRDGSDCEVDGIEKEYGHFLFTYSPNEKIARRLEKELPFRIELVFEGGIYLILKVQRY